MIASSQLSVSQLLHATLIWFPTGFLGYICVMHTLFSKMKKQKKSSQFLVYWRLATPKNREILLGATFEIYMELFSYKKNKNIKRMIFFYQICKKCYTNIPF